MLFNVQGTFNLMICSHHDSESEPAKVEGVIFAAGSVKDIVKTAYMQLATLIRSYYGLNRTVDVDDRQIGVDWEINIHIDISQDCDSTFKTDGTLVNVVHKFGIHVSDLVRNRLEIRQRIAKDNFDRAKEELESISVALLNLPDSEEE